MRTISSLLLAALATSSLCSAQKSKPAAPDAIFFNAVIYTGEGFAQDHPQIVQAMAIRDSKIIAIGTTDQVTRLAGPRTVLHDLGGSAAFIFPGFNDAHTHLSSAGRTKLNIDLTGVKSLDQMLAKIQAAANAAPPGHWLTGGNWDHTLWADKKLPTRHDLDKVTAGHPTFLDRIDGHIAIANSAALAAASITGKTQPPQGGAIDLDSNGEPTGIVRESAQDLIYKVIPPPTHEERRKGDELAIHDALTHGVTSVQDFSDWQDFLVFEEMEKQGDLHLRISEWIPFKDSLDDLKKMRAHHNASDPMLHTGMLKGFMDGSLGSRTAAMKAPYADDPGNTGLPQYTQDQLNKMAIKRARAGFQLGFHAIGDKATSMALDAFTIAQKAMKADAEMHAGISMPPCRPVGQPYTPMDEKMPCASSIPRNRIEHAQVVDPADIPRFKQLGVIASMQPNHLLTDMNWAVDRLGPQRAAYSYAWKAFLTAGVPLAFGTDYPVEPITPFRGLYAAVTRMNEAGTKTYYPENKITRGQALAAYTQGSAYAEFAEQHKGKLIPGYDADFILVDRDLYKIDAPEILGTKVLKTYVAGRDALN
jgi:predicted amidohydrolase YtcJ